MINPVKIAFGKLVTQWQKQLFPDGKQVKEFSLRASEKAIAFADSRMVDDAQAMLDLWQKNKTDNAPSSSARLPVVLIAIARDFTSGNQYHNQIKDSLPVVLAADPKERVFNLRTLGLSLRVQMAFIADNDTTARALVAQWHNYINSPSRRNMNAIYQFAGFSMPWGVSFEIPQNYASNIAIDANNICILTVDMTLNATVPMYENPQDDEPNDGKGTDGNLNDPHGYPVVLVINSTEFATL
jgi:hypothetical protein